MRRDNRFRVSVELRGQVTAAHLPNSGRLSELLVRGATVWLAPATTQSRKTAFDLTLVEYGGELVSVDARLPNHLLHEAIKTLPRQAEKVIILALNGYKNEEIAQELGVSVNTIKTQKKRAYHALREKLGNQFIAIILCQFIDFF